MGSYQRTTTSGQTGSPIRIFILDEETDELLDASLICSCSHEVEAYETGHFYCPHCDYVCKIEECDYCYEYDRIVNMRQITE